MTKERNSSFELLRIILILLILIEHGNMWFIGGGYLSEAEHLAKCVVESVCVGSVNAFVLISGWFGIKSGMRKIWNLSFMIMFCTIPALIASFALGWLPLGVIASWQGIYEYVLGGGGYWFVVDYIGLLIVTPLLNAAVETVTRNQLRGALIAGYILILIYDFALRTSVLGIEGGYSLGWFVYLYLLARYIRVYGAGGLCRYRWTVLIGAVAIQSAMFYFGLIGLRYTNPLILAASICVVLIFSHYYFKSKVINHVATAVLMAYLLHMQPVLLPYIRRFLLTEYIEAGYWMYMVEVLVLSCAVIVIALPLNMLQSAICRKIKLCWSR